MNDKTPPQELLLDVPDSLHQVVSLSWQHWVESCDASSAEVHPAGIELRQLGYLWACSEFVAQLCTRQPQRLHGLLADGIDEPIDSEHLDAVLQQKLDTGDDPRKVVRQFRHEHTLRIAMRDLLRLADIDTLLSEQSILARVIVSRMVQRTHTDLCQQIGVPRDEEGREQHLIVMAMGKLGGGELNFSSDIDLISCYPSDGKTDGRPSLSNHEFFARQLRDLVTALDDVTEDGFVFRVDTRLRPYGASGPAAMSFNALENYYQSQGREWERYAMIKAVAISGEAEDIRTLTSILRPFVYRKYLDYNVFEGIAEMKTMIDSQVSKRSMQGNIKLGRGGIREIEFIAQTFQLLRGGRDRRLQAPGLFEIYHELEQQAVLETDEVRTLLRAYRFLREVENRLQIEKDQQTHSLPTAEESQQRLLCAMRLDDWQALLDLVDNHTSSVQRLFSELIQQPETDVSSGFVTSLGRYMNRQGEVATDREDLQQSLAHASVEFSEDELDSLDTFSGSAAFRHAPDATRDRCVELIASLLLAIDDQHANETLSRLLDILSAIMGRSVYLSMLLRYPLLQQRLIWLCESGQWFSDQIRSMPLLLDEVLDSGEHPSLSSRDQLETEFRDRLSAVPAGDFELLLDSLRVFKQNNVFRIAMLDVIAAHPVTELADRLSEIAEMIVEAALEMAWDDIVARHGIPRCEVDGETITPGISIIAYGKMGGKELGYGSDLDVVFLHNSRGEKQYTDGEKSIDNASFFARVVQRLLHILGTRTFSGVLYEIDTRLRPDGQSGLMVASTSSFENYQQDRAWTWEHQALVRARAVAGDELAAQEFDTIRRSVLTRERDWSALARDVVEMREKMRQHLASKDGGIDLKQDAGGLVDIEFIAQAGVLLNAATRPSLCETTSTLELLDELADIGWLDRDDVNLMAGAYVELRRMANYQTLGVEIDDRVEQCAQSMASIAEIWCRVFPDQ